MTDLEQRIAALEAAVDRLASQSTRDLSRIALSIDFVRTHMSNYIGNGRALTYMAGDIPIFVNSDDAGGPANLINGGRYEIDNLDLLLSFVTPDTVFLDIGANLGFFSINVGTRLSRTGAKVHAFEPHPELSQLLWRSSFLNGLNSVITVHPIGLGDRDSEVEFGYPVGHLGGGVALPVGYPDEEAGGPRLLRVRAPIKRLDDAMPPDFECDLVKIDVEGGEIQVLRGMERIIKRSRPIKILLEKLEQAEAFNVQFWEALRDLGFRVYSISSPSRLDPVQTLEAFSAISGYVFASKVPISELSRTRFSIFPSQMFGPFPPSGSVMEAEATQGHALAFGPYWPLQRGVYRIAFAGTMKGVAEVLITERAGHIVASSVSEDGKDVIVTVDRDLSRFECVVRAQDRPASMRLERIDVIRL